jgi:hypothetical protein
MVMILFTTSRACIKASSRDLLGTRDHTLRQRNVVANLKRRKHLFYNMHQGFMSSIGFPKGLLGLLARLSGLVQLLSHP